MKSPPSFLGAPATSVLLRYNTLAANLHIMIAATMRPVSPGWRAASLVAKAPASLSRIARKIDSILSCSSMISLSQYSNRSRRWAGRFLAKSTSHQRW